MKLALRFLAEKILSTPWSLFFLSAVLLTARLQALPTLEFATSGAEVNELLFYGNGSNENDGFASFSLNRPWLTNDVTLTVDWETTSDGTAVPGMDYFPT